MAYDTQSTPPPSMYNVDNPYGFKLNVNHPRINALWKRFKTYKGIYGRPPTDDERREFERIVLSSKDATQSNDSIEKSK